MDKKNKGIYFIIIALFLAICVVFFMFLGKDGKNTSKDNADVTSGGIDYSAMNGQYDDNLGGVLNDGVVYEITDEKNLLMSAKTYYDTDLEKFEIPDEVTYKEKKYKVTEIQKNAFESNQFMTEIKIGKNVSKIGKEAFYSCPALKNADMSQSVKIIGASAFAECSSLETVKFAKSLTDIGKEAFCDCTALKSVTVPSGVKVMGDGVFFGCEGLEECILEDGLEIIGANMFTNCTSIKKIKLPKSIQSIGKEAFWSCTSIKEMSLPKSVKAVGDSAFYDSGIEKLNICSKEIMPSDKLLDGADNLQKLYVPELLKSQYEDFYDIASFEVLQLEK